MKHSEAVRDRRRDFTGVLADGVPQSSCPPRTWRGTLSGSEVFADIIKLRSHWSRMSPSDKCPHQRRRETWTHTGQTPEVS